MLTNTYNIFEKERKIGRNYMKIFIRDLKYQVKKFLLPLLVLVIVYTFLVFLTSDLKEDMSLIESFFNGAYFDSGVITQINGMTIPDRWLLLHLIPVINLLVIFIKDHYENGIYTILKLEKKTHYFFSKILASIIINVVSIGIFAIPFLIYISSEKGNDPNLVTLFKEVMFCLTLENIILTIGAIIIALLSSTMVAIFVVISNMAIAMASNFPYIIGQSSLAYMQETLGGPLKFTNNLIFLLVLLVVLIVFSYIYFNRYNYYGDEK